MFRFSLRSLVGITAVTAVLIAIGYYYAKYENEVERDIRLYGATPIQDPDRLFAEVERLAELGDQAQSSDSYDYISKDESKLSRIELAQIAHHYRKQYPFVSLRTRLAYEANASPKAVLPEATLARMELAEDPSRGGMVKARYTPIRTQALHQLHSEWVFQFITQEGVGVSRMPFASVWNLPLADSPATEFDSLGGDAPEPGPGVKILSEERERYQFERDWKQDDSSNYQNGIDRVFVAWAEKHNPKSIPTRPRLAWHYEQDRLQFGESGRNGYARDVDHVAGFASHQLVEPWSIRMDRPWGSYDSTKSAAPDRHWVLKSLQLVSLLKHDRPQVYVSKQLPNMQSPGTNVRNLNPFERRSLQELYAGEDLCIEGRENQVRMLGSLRAIRQCLDCHTVDRGELLGAFSYELVRTAPHQAVAKAQ